MTAVRQSFASVMADALLRDTANSVEASQFVISFAAWTALLTHPLYWYIWTYWFPQPHESVFLRFSSALLAVPLLLRSRWPHAVQRFFPLYWLAVITYILPVLFTYLALWNNFNDVWLLCHLGLLLLLIILLPTATMYAVILALGTAIGVLLFRLSGGSLQSVQVPAFYVPIVSFVFLFCVGFMHQARLSAAVVVRRAATDRQRTLMSRALSATIAHEVRKPVAQSLQALGLIKEGLTDLERLGAASDNVELRLQLDYLKRTADLGYSSVVRGDMLIRMILRNIREERIDPSDYQVLSMAAVVRGAVESYAFARGQRERVRLYLDDDFSVRGDENLLMYLLFNLLQNALVYDAGRANLRVEIRLGHDEQGGWLTVRDNGPGIPPERLTGIFESFMTDTSKQGTGLGLPFCKRVMTAVGGSIAVHSNPGSGAEFRLRFPPLGAQAIAPKVTPGISCA